MTHSFFSRFGRLAFAALIALIGLAALLFLLQPSGHVKADSIAVGLVLDGPTTEDGGFNWLSYQGLLRAQAQLGVTGTVYTATDPGDYEPNLNQCVADGNALCLSVGFLTGEAISNVAAANPGTYFAIIDNAWDNMTGNLRGMVFAAEQAGYLAGTLAGLMTDNGVIGDIGGMPIPPVDAFLYPYRNGAHCADPAVTVLISYTYDFGNPQVGAQMAQAMIGQGADVIFAAAGGAGVGSVLTATQSGVWGIGVDTDFYYSIYMSGTISGTEKLLSSAMKRLDNAVYDTIGDVISGTFSAGETLYDLAADGVGLAPFHDTDPYVPGAVRDQLALVTAGILSGTIDVHYDCPLLSGVLYLPAVFR